MNQTEFTKINSVVLNAAKQGKTPAVLMVQNELPFATTTYKQDNYLCMIHMAENVRVQVKKVIPVQGQLLPDTRTHFDITYMFALDKWYGFTFI